MARSAPRQIMCETSSSLILIFSDDNKTIEEEEDVHDDDDDASTKNGKLSMSIDCIIGIITDVIVDDHRGRWPGNVHREARDGIVRRERRRGTRLGGFGEKMENADEMTEGMDDAMFAKRFYCSKEQFAKISSKNVEGGAKNAKTTTYIFATSPA